MARPSLAAGSRAIQRELAMTIDWACAAPVLKPWGRVGLLPWSAMAVADEAIGELWFHRTTPGAAPPRLLLKLLFTTEPLSIQVRPDDDFAHAMGLENGKSEVWYVLEAAAGAKVGLGL